MTPFEKMKDKRQLSMQHRKRMLTACGKMKEKRSEERKEIIWRKIYQKSEN